MTIKQIKEQEAEESIARTSTECSRESDEKRLRIIHAGTGEVLLSEHERAEIERVHP